MENTEYYPLPITSVESPVPAPWIRFCGAYPSEVGSPINVPVIVPYSLVVWSEICVANTKHNLGIIKTDDEAWELYPAYGGSGSVAVTKRHYLHHKSWPDSALLLAEVECEGVDGFYWVLVVRTKRGDFILDRNFSGLPEQWWQRDYRFKCIQSPFDPNKWVHADSSLRPVRSTREMLKIPE